ncbi:hypothetical protein GS399_10920 [Pedobacter sp. HMF7647]|uniref:PadR family transcriptional regulator n=1 Tax=Hufsiella arboris TaxID=2695275 RepID=A0A7K1YA89_9SPHI|nr:hypothetical protein [Hufsiella arboris]MXV51482.1 hypothetical protein [Hufsiella arboris]
MGYHLGWQEMNTSNDLIYDLLKQAETAGYINKVTVKPEHSNALSELISMNYLHEERPDLFILTEKGIRMVKIYDSNQKLKEKETEVMGLLQLQEQVELLKRNNWMVWLALGISVLTFILVMIT